MRRAKDSDFENHRLTRSLLLTTVAFAFLYGFFIVNFVDSSYAATHGLTNAQVMIPLTNSTLTNSTSNSSCTYPASNSLFDFSGLFTSRCGSNSGCVTMQPCLETPVSGASTLPPLSSLYGVWLFSIYFAPFVLLSLYHRREHWEMFLSLGLLVWFVNDGLWGIYHLLIAPFFNDPLDFAPWAFFNPSSPTSPSVCDCASSSSPLSPARWGSDVFVCWFKNWYLMSPRLLFIQPPIPSQYPITGWLMSLTLYARIVTIGVLMYKWKADENGGAKSWRKVRSNMANRFKRT